MHISSNHISSQPSFPEENINISKGNQNYNLIIRNVGKLKPTDIENLKTVFIASEQFPKEEEVTIRSDSKIFDNLIQAIPANSRPENIKKVEFVIKKAVSEKIEQTLSVRERVKKINEITSQQVVKSHSRNDSSNIANPTKHLHLPPPPPYNLPPKPTKKTERKSFSIPSSSQKNTEPPPLPRSKTNKL